MPSTRRSPEVGADAGAVASMVPTGASWAVRRARQWVKTPDHANMIAKAMTSNRARLMVSSTNSHAPAKSSTKADTVVSRRRFGMRCRRIGDVSSSALNPSTIMAATLSCRLLMVLSGMQPTSARFTPTVVRQICAMVAAPRRAAVRPRRTRSRRTRTAKTTTIMPPTLRVLLNSPPERSWNVPSWLKCSCHHWGSLVVRMEARMPPTSTTSTSPATCIVGTAPRRCEKRDAVRPPRGRAEETAMLMSGTFHQDGAGVPRHRETPASVGTIG